MAKTKYPTPTFDAQLTHGELSIKAFPGINDTWIGTAKQLLDEGLVPDDFRWPDRTESVFFDHDGFECCVARKAPKGRPRGQQWVHVDNWCLIRWVEGRASGLPLILMNLREVKLSLWLQSPEGKKLTGRFALAQMDEAFQAVKRRVFGLSREPARSAAPSDQPTAH
jgi:hypothetical protein